VDVVLNSLTGDLLHESWKACAEFGYFIEIGKRDILDGGRLDMHAFERGLTFTAFDLTSLYWSESESRRGIWSRQEFLSLFFRFCTNRTMQALESKLGTASK
jgi:hypothetical protein